MRSSNQGMSSNPEARPLVHSEYTFRILEVGDTHPHLHHEASQLVLAVLCCHHLCRSQSTRVIRSCTSRTAPKASQC